MHNNSKHQKTKSKTRGNIIFFVLFAVLFVVVTGYFVMKEDAPVEIAQYDDFANYLTSQGAIMYGTEWCTHCKDQKALFGNSFVYVNYIDCDKNNKACSEAGVTNYPTWIINGQKYMGLQSLATLMGLSGYDEFADSASDSGDNSS